MMFKNGIEAIVCIHDEKKTFFNTTDMCEFLNEHFVEDNVIDTVQKWAESASENDSYHDEEFDIYMK